MPRAELPPSIPRQSRDLGDDSVVEFKSGLPASVPEWCAALLVWPAIDEHSHRLTARCFDSDEGKDWRSFSGRLVMVGLAEEIEADSYRFAEDWQPAVARGLDLLGGADAVRARLFEAWLEEPDRHVVGQVAAWARESSRWDVLERVWLFLGEQAGGLSTQTLEVLRDLPIEARQERPILTWASGAADSLLAASPGQAHEAVLQRLLLDSAMLHADWSVRHDTDNAVSAGTFRMIGERRLPSTHVGQSLEAAWRTKQEIDALIDSRSRSGRGPGRTPQAIFRAFSSRLALFRTTRSAPSMKPGGQPSLPTGSRCRCWQPGSRLSP